MVDHRRSVGAALSLIAGTMYGFLGYFTNIFEEYGFSSADVAFIRVTVPIIPVLFIILSLDTHAFAVRLKDLWIFIASGVLQSLGYLFFFKSMTMIPVSVSTVLCNMLIVFIVIIAFIVYKTKITKMKAASIVLCFIGAAFAAGIFSESGRVDGLGFIIGLAAAPMFALNRLTAELAVKRGYGTMTIVFYTMLFSSLSLLPFADLSGLAGSMGEPTLYNTMIIIGIGLTLIPAGMLTAAYNFVESTTVSVLCISEVPASAVIGYLLLNQELSPSCIIGIAVITVSLILIQLDGYGQKAEVKPPDGFASAKNSFAAPVSEAERKKMTVMLVSSALLVLVTSALTFQHSYHEDIFGASLSCITAFALLAAGAYYLILSVAAQSGHMTAIAMFRRVIRCIGGITLFTSVFCIPYDVEGVGLAILMGAFFIYCGYRLGKGSDLARKATLLLLIFVLVALLFTGIADIGSESLMYSGICNVMTAVMMSAILFDKSVFMPMVRGCESPSDPA